MDVVGVMAAPPDPLQQQQTVKAAERLNPSVVQQLNLESVRTRALGLSKAIARILDEFNAIARANATPKWQDVLGQFSMVNLELHNIMEDIKKVSKAFVVYPKNVNAESATILPVMLSSKLLPEMEAEDNVKREQLLHGMQNLPAPVQIEKLKNRIEMIGAACESAEKIISDARKTYGLAARQGPTLIPTLDKAQAAKIQEQENLLRAAVNFGEGLRIAGDQRHISSLPMHLADVLLLPHADGTHNIGDMAGSHPKSMPPSFSHSNAIASQSVMQGPGSQLLGRTAPSPSGTTALESASTPPLHYSNSPRSSTNLMNTPSPQQQQAQQQQQQRQKIMQMSAQQQQQMLSQHQQLRQSSNAGLLNQVPGQHQMPYSQSLTQQQFQNRQLQTAMQHNLSQNQINQGNQLRSNLGQFTGSTNSTLFNAAQTTQNPQLFGLSSAQRNYSSQILNDQMFNMGAANPASMVAMPQQQQQLGGQGALGNMATNAQNLQAGLVGLNQAQNTNFQQQRQMNQQQ